MDIKLKSPALRFTFLLSIILLVTSSCNNASKKESDSRFKNAKEYNDYVIDKHTDLMLDQLEFGKQAAIDLDTAKVTLDRLLIKAKSMYDEIKTLPAYDKDSTFRDAAAESFAFYIRTFEKSYPELLELKRKGTDATPDEQLRMQTIIKELGEEEELHDTKLKAAQEAFASKHNLSLEIKGQQKKLQEELEKAE